jgi:hypothetical protein
MRTMNVQMYKTASISIAANLHPDHDTIATFRRRFLPQIAALFVQVLMMARGMGWIV